MFATNRHLDLEPFDESKVLAVSVTTAVDALLGAKHLEAVFTGDTETNLACTLARSAAKPSREDLLALCKRFREEALLKPVVKVEVQLLDVYREKRHWNLTLRKVECAARSPAFAEMRTAAEERGFTTAFNGQHFHNAHGHLRVNLSFLFHRREKGAGRTYTEVMNP